MFDRAEKINPLFDRIFKTMRATDVENPTSERSNFYASQDDLLNRVKLSEWSDFLQFVVASLRDTARIANQEIWPTEQVDLQIGIQGIWFQISNGGLSHDIHTHGNCSWSGVYVVSVDDDETRCRHPVYGRLNGATRFYSPLFERLVAPIWILVTLTYKTAWLILIRFRPFDRISSCWLIKQNQDI